MNIEPNFDRVARLYRWAEYLSLGPLLQQTRTYFLPQLSTSRKALILGDGDGRFTQRLLEANQQVHVQAVDISKKMLTLLSERCDADASRLTTIQASAMAIQVLPATDLIVTHFFLDCLTQAQVAELAFTISRSCSPGTLWLVSDFSIPANWLAWPSRLYIRALYMAFRMLTHLRVQQLPDTASALTQAGFSCIQRHTRLGGLIYTELWQRE